MIMAKSSVGAIYGTALFLLVFFALVQQLGAQEVGVTTSTMHDENIFDSYKPVPDQITQTQLDLSKGWDFDMLSLGAYYTGAMLWFRDLQTRNYHAHYLMLDGSYQLDSHDDEEDDSDSSESVPPKPQISLDSLNHVLSGTIVASSAFDREEFRQYDHTSIAANVMFRQPIGLWASVRPAYSFAYRRYPNIPGITNVQNVVAIVFGTSVMPNGWITLTPMYTIKNYPTRSTFTYTVTVPEPSGHGKGSGKGTTRDTTIEFTTPSVNQFVIGLGWKQKIISGTTVTAKYMRYGAPSSQARVVTQQQLDERGVVTDITSENDIIDDPLSYSGNELRLQLNQALPLAIQLTVSSQYTDKTYTYEARDLSGSVVAPNRHDERTTIGVRFSRVFKLASYLRSNPQFEINYLRNTSNAPYYDFHKSTYTIGVEFDF
jgi:hypothetical protein